ncbi:uncharacterized protein Dwil_GK13491 [Drosophila willistoni]|uniref:Uncharacterized protein n=1 Tax=Drosophila willistoni TaxID=7260 RepID=B4NIS0_DROWI|nr:uncharacterized protein LOC6650172 [Drosophila willistoni]EDW83784.1 uncharacterized protein Dwil_GK13491 [Drosophila willistoni]
MQRRCIICGQEPSGYYVYPRTLTEARKWQDWANLYSFNVPAGTLRKHGCVCQKHLEAAEELGDTPNEHIVEVEERNVGGMPTPICEPNDIVSNDVMDKRPSVSFTESDPNQRPQRPMRCCCPNVEATKPKEQKPRRRKERRSPSQGDHQPFVNVCYCPGTTQIPRPPFQYNPIEAMKYNVSPTWFNQQSSQQQQQPNWNQFSETGTEMDAFNGQSSRYYQQASDCLCGSYCPLLGKKLEKMHGQEQQLQQPGPIQQQTGPMQQQTGPIQQQSQCCQCYISVPNQDKTIQCPSQVHGAEKRRQAPAENCECGTTTTRNIVVQPTVCIPANIYEQYQAPPRISKPKSKKKETKVRKNPNSVNVLIMGSYGQEEDAEVCKEMICPETFQPSPLTEICFLESDLTRKNERAIFPDIDLPNYSVCRAPTTDPKATEEADTESNKQDDANCADVLVLGKGLYDIDPCPCDCQHCLFDMNLWNCPNHINPRVSAQPQETGANNATSGIDAQSFLPKQWADGNWQDPQAVAKYNQVIADQKARINELEDLLTQHNILQETIQSKVDELQCKVEANDSRVKSKHPLSDLDRSPTSALGTPRRKSNTTSKTPK